MELISRQTRYGPISTMAQRLGASRRERRAAVHFATAETNLVAGGFTFEPIELDGKSPALDLASVSLVTKAAA